MKILVADDSRFMRQILIDILKRNSFTEIIEAADGKETLEKFFSEKPDLILLDIIMPVLDGLGVLDQIGHLVPIIIVSAVGQADILWQAHKKGAVSYITKPFQGDEVVREVKKVAGK